MAYRQHVDPKSLLKTAVKNSHFVKNYAQYEEEIKRARREVQHLKRKYKQLKAELLALDEENGELSEELSGAYRTIDSMNDLCGTEESLRNKVKDLRRIITNLQISIRRLEERKRYLKQDILNMEQ